MREKITQKSKSLLLYFSLMLLAVIGSTAYAAEMIAGEGEETSAEATIKSVVLQNGEEVTDLMAGTAVEALIHGSYIVVELENADDVNLLAWELKFKETGESYKTISMEAEKSEDGKFSFRISGKRDYELNTGVEYELVFTGWASKNDVNSKNPNFQKSVVIKGGTATYAYSSTTLVEPAELLYEQGKANFTLKDAEDNKIPFVFSDAVTIDKAIVNTGFGSSVDCDVEMSEDNKVATVVIPSSIMNEYTEIQVSIYAKGADGQAVKGNCGDNENSYISVYVDTKFNLPEATMIDPAPNSTVESIKTIKFGYDKGINGSFLQKISIYNKTRELVATSTEVEQVIPEDQQGNKDYIPTEVIVHFDNEITTSGEYSIVVPENMFNLDLQSQGFDIKNNREASYIVLVDAQQSGTLNISVAPQEGEVASLKEFEFTFMSYNTCTWTGNENPIFKKDGVVVETINNTGWGDGNNQLVCSLAEEVTEPGTYTLTIPAGSVTYNDDDKNVNTEDVTFTYVIADRTGENVVTVPAAGTVGELPASIKIKFADQTEVATSGNGQPTLVDQDGKPFDVDLHINNDWAWNELELTLNDGAITTPGTYTLTIPAGAVAYGYMGDSYNNKLTFVYTVTGEGGDTGKEPTIKKVVMTDGDLAFDFSWGEPIAKFINDFNLVVELENGDNVGYMTWEVMDKATGEFVKSISPEQAKGEDGLFTFWIPSDCVLGKDLEYELILTGWESLDTYHYGQPNFNGSITIKGGTELYAYSSAKLIEPAELLYNQNEANFSLANAEDNKISFTFSEPVTITEAIVPTGGGTHVNCEVEMSEDKKVATIIVPSSVMTEFAQFAVSILAKGEDGQVVKGNNGEDAESYISVLVDAKFNLPEVTMVDPAPNATVESIKTIKFGYDKGIGASWIGNITILDKTRNEVAKSVDIEQVIPEDEMDNWDYVPTEVIVTFNNEITTSGAYTIIVPEGVFNLDLESQGFQMKNNREAVFNLFVDNDSPMPQVNVTIDPVPGNVASLKDFDITFNDADEAGWGDGFPTLTTPDGTTIVIKNEDYGVEYNELVCNLDEEITEPGEYIFTLPAGCVNLDGNPTTEDYQFKYTIVAAGSNDVTLDPAPGQVTEIPASIKVIFNNEDEISVGTGSSYITNDRGEVFKATLDINYAWELNALELKLTDGAITKNGTYTLTIPAGSVNDTDGNGILVDYTFVYIIGDGNSVNGIAADAENAEVYNAAGVFVGKGVKNLKPGQMYIIKGKKFDVRK